MSLTSEQINNLLGVTESFKASFKLAEILQDKQQREQLFDKFLEIEQDLSFDWFCDYYQEEHSNRKDDKQDFTPDGVVDVAVGVLGDTRHNADICAGTGGLTVKVWANNPTAELYCEELSERAFPFLLFNLAIRNVSGWALRGDSLKREFREVYHLTRGERYSEIAKSCPDDCPNIKQTVIMNPPYSLKWEPDESLLQQSRFIEFENLAPKSKADYAFMLTGLDQLGPGGTLVAIMPHGVLFRGASEEAIRRQLIRLNYLDAVIGLPEKVFLNTDIPTTVLVLKKNRQRTDTLFIDASKEFTKGKWNIIEAQHAEKIVSTYNTRRKVDKFSHVATLEEIEENDYNLNIPRYVDTFEPEPVLPLSTLVEEFISIDEEIDETRGRLAEMVSQLTSNNEHTLSELKAFTDYLLRKSGKAVPKKDAPKRRAATYDQLRFL